MEQLHTHALFLFQTESTQNTRTGHFCLRPLIGVFYIWEDSVRVLVCQANAEYVFLFRHAETGNACALRFIL